MAVLPRSSITSDKTSDYISPPRRHLTTDKVSISHRQCLNVCMLTINPSTTPLHPLKASQIIHYSVPQTQIGIVIWTGSPISGSAMYNTLEACLSAADAAISKHGDVYMFPDPYVFKTPPALHTGLEIKAYSMMVPGLKWIDLSHVLSGVEQAMWQRALYKEAHVKIYDEPSGLWMGIADLIRSSTINLVDTRDLA